MPGATTMWPTAVLARALVRATVLLTTTAPGGYGGGGGDGGGEGGEGGEGGGGGKRGGDGGGECRSRYTTVSDPGARYPGT